MNSMLVVNSSARMQRSISRRLVDIFVNEVSMSAAQGAAGDVPLTVVERDVGATPPGFIDEHWIDAVFTDVDRRTAAQRARVAESDLLIQELKNASTIVIGAPMYNYGMPATLKAWFDQIVRVNETFSFDLARGDYPLEPILAGKSLVLMTSKGEFGFAPGEERAALNHLDGHIELLAKYLGVEEIHQIHVEFQEFGDERHQKSLHRAYIEASELGVKFRRQWEAEALQMEAVQLNAPRAAQQGWQTRRR
ncbi:FMN-dependent NADH-azoreductase 1 [BD1-7 clade bacterium]|nr:FMN-dependent NADH-azoreductase 1 [BD1-7 clade bacterium]